MTAPLSSIQRSIAARGTLRAIAGKVVEQSRPRIRHGALVTIDHAANLCTVLFNGDVDPVYCYLGSSHPYTVGTIVRVSEQDGELWVDDIVTPGDVYVGARRIASPVGTQLELGSGSTRMVFHPEPPTANPMRTFHINNGTSTWFLTNHPDIDTWKSSSQTVAINGRTGCTLNLYWHLSFDRIVTLCFDLSFPSPPPSLAAFILPGVPAILRQQDAIGQTVVGTAIANTTVWTAIGCFIHGNGTDYYVTTMPTSTTRVLGTFVYTRGKGALPPL